MNDCNGVNLKVRHSFMRRKPSNYQALEYDDMRFLKFGYFRTERYTYDPDYGAVDYAASRLANRWNIWGDNTDCYDPEAELPYATCDKNKLKPIVYYLNADFPTEYMEFAQSNAAEWNTVFKEAVAAGSGWNTDDIMDMFVICENNPVQAGDPAVCVVRKALSPQIGDLRYSMYFFVPNEQSSSPLGYGPSADDPLTGELIQGNAFYYGAPGRWIARRTMDIFKYEKGLLTAEEIGAAVPARNAVSTALNRENSNISRRGAFDIEKVKRTFDELKILEKADCLKEKLNTGEAFHDMSEANLYRVEKLTIKRLHAY